ncbi:hypothetical protein DUNSADRAFT_3201 [Dunaliella salina]|uniref:STEEP1 domain-containing protein n=1 Tax=Dunaliella salina TaxID=3046 RepID=A0ABQ7GUF4_DUNSA|nr:hypothetical protein DUNSADRAFT_3201 [Dunaliella salina]|eukprot:KAF5838221.1 hypothetical protein DUNSADRAFT_3201 [Dunaliella salina]
MPKRTTLTFTSEDAPQQQGAAEQLYVYYCKYTGKHAFTIDTDINKLPRRRTDGARIVDTGAHSIKLYTTPGGSKLIRSPLIYILGDAVVTYVNQAVIHGDKVLVPPCIRHHKASGGTEVRLEIEDRVHRPALVKITADHVRIHITSNIAADTTQPEILQMMGKALNARLTNLQLMKGQRSRSRYLIVDHMTPEEVFEKLQASVGRINTQTEQEKKITGRS